MNWNENKTLHVSYCMRLIHTYMKRKWRTGLILEMRNKHHIENFDQLWRTERNQWKTNTDLCTLNICNNWLRYYYLQVSYTTGNMKKSKKAASWQNQQNDCAPSEDSDQPGHSPSLIRVFAVRMKKAWVLSYPLSAQRRLWSDLADAQADLSLRWAHSHLLVLSWGGSIYRQRLHSCCILRQLLTKLLLLY